MCKIVFFHVYKILCDVNFFNAPHFQKKRANTVVGLWLTFLKLDYGKYFPTFLK